MAGEILTQLAVAEAVADEIHTLHSLRLRNGCAVDAGMVGTDELPE